MPAARKSKQHPLDISQPEGAVNYRGEPDPDMHYRAMPVRIGDDGRPATLDEETRSVEAVLATETPVRVYDWQHGEYADEILLMSGFVKPTNNRVSMLDTHMRYSTYTVVGSMRNFAVQGSELVCRAHFTDVSPGDNVWPKVAQGHITDFSAGWKPVRKKDDPGIVWIPAGQTAQLAGRSFTGPARIVTRWTVREGSICAIGQDENAKTRSEPEGHKEGADNMNEQLKQFLITRGLKKDATDEETLEFLQRTLPENDGGEGGGNRSVTVPAAPAPVPAPVIQLTENDITEARRTEQNRILGIRGVCERFGESDQAKIQEYITKNRSVESVQFEVMERAIIRDRNESTPGAGVRVTMDEMDKVRAAGSDAIMLRAGFQVEKPAAGATEIAGFTMIEMGREILKRSGGNASGTPMEIARRAMSTSDFPLILANTANKSLMQGWEEASETWNEWVDTGEVNDFKSHTMVRPSEIEDLLEVKEGGEYKYSYRDEAGETYRVYKFGRLVSYTWEMMINDDLSALTDIPRQQGEACNRKTGDVVYAVLTSNSAMGDSIALFEAGTHGNLVASGSGAAPSVTTLDAAELAMGGQKDIAGLRRLNIRPAYFISPLALKGSAEVFFKTATWDASNAASTRANTWSGDRIKRVYESRLDDDSAKVWYLAAQKGKTVRAFFLRGHRAPFMDRQEGFNVDGVVWKVRHVVGAKAIDWRGMYKNAGE